MDGVNARYRYGGFAVSGILADEVLLDHLVSEPHTLAPNLAGCFVSAGTLPSGTFTLTVARNGVEIGTMTIAPSGATSLLTTGGSAQAISAGDFVSVRAPAIADPAIGRLRFTLTAALA